MKTKGACHCGAIHFEAEVDENRISLCHCRDCQILSGSAFRTAARVEPSKFAVTQGTPKYYDKIADSGATRRMAFCGNCGTHICSLPSDPATEGSYVSLRVSATQDFLSMKIAGEIWCDSRVAWLDPIEGAVQFPGQP